MPLGAARITLLALGATVVAEAEIIRLKKGIIALYNAQVSTAQSKFGGASFLSDGTDDCLEVAHNGAINFETGDFTVEAWVYPTDIGSTEAIAGEWSSSIGYKWLFTYSGAGTNNGLRFGYNGGSFTTSTSQGINYNTWSHVAVVRSAGTRTFYINGVAAGSATLTTNIGTVGNVRFNGIDYSNRFAPAGYMDEMRISNTARYTGAFTPSTTPFVNDADTLVLIHADGTNASTFFEDDNGVRAQKGVSAPGAAKISTVQSKFGGSSAYLQASASDTRILAYNAADGIGTGDYTLETWYRPATFTSTNAITYIGGVAYYVTSAGYMAFYSGSGLVATTQQMTVNNWYHIAWVRNSGTVRMYVNGILTTSVANSASHTGDIRIGAKNANDQDMDGYLDEYRISDTARYTGAFTPSTTPFQNDANTLLLLHMDGTNASTVFTDDNGAGRSQKGIQAIGNAQVDTAQSKFGSSSLLLDGTGDYLFAPTDLAPGTNDFTFEGWFRFPNNNVDYAIFGADGFNGDFVIRRVNDGTVRLGRDDTAWDLSSSATTIANTWAHIAVCRSGTTAKTFLNGTQIASATNTINYVLTNQFRIGSNAGGGADFNGHMDEIRISNVGRYTAAFTAPTAPFQNDANTLLLLHMDGTDASTTFTDDNGVY